MFSKKLINAGKFNLKNKNECKEVYVHTAKLTARRSFFLTNSGNFDFGLNNDIQFCYQQKHK